MKTMLLPFTALLMTPLAAISASETPKSAKPNVLLILADNKY
jgi:hypothetical protein